MRKAHVKDHFSSEDLRARMHSAQSKAQFQRWQAVYLLKTQAIHVATVAELVNVSPKTVYHWVHAYNKEGEAALELQGRGGRRRALLSWEEEQTVLQELQAEASQGLIVLSRQVKQKAEEKLGRTVSKDYAYDLLHRHGWRKVAPRPTHPERRADEQDAYKKNSRRWWWKPRRALHPPIGGP